MSSVQDCPCGSKKQFKQCCGRFLDQGQQAKTPEQLMRSRFSAYALGGYGKYLLQTWLPATAPDLNEVELSVPDVQWQQLQIVDKSQKGDDGTVEFKAHFINKQGEPEVMHEKSVFKRIAGRWLYIGGEVS
ncbi:MAG: SEC-C domain-containing protein [Pseudomonadales bacterium]|nr:SEC-C domain-containing protein [Pseudomonadales bacterium]